MAGGGQGDLPRGAVKINQGKVQLIGNLDDHIMAIERALSLGGYRVRSEVADPGVVQFDVSDRDGNALGLFYYWFQTQSIQNSSGSINTAEWNNIKGILC